MEEDSSDEEEEIEDPMDPDPNILPSRTRNRPAVDYRGLHGVREYKKRGFAARACKVSIDTAPAVPSNVYEALRGPDKEKWQQALTEELNSLKEKGTWDTPRPPQPGRKIFPGRWVLTHKLDSMGEFSRYKARWVVKGFRQIEGVDFNETFSSVVKSMSWRILLALGAKYDYEIEHSDVVTAFLEAMLKEEVWVEQPHGFTNGNDSDACRLRRALYGLKQSREWYATLREFLESIGYKRLTKDSSILIHENGMIVAVYVDDLLELAPTKALIADFKPFCICAFGQTLSIHLFTYDILLTQKFRHCCSLIALFPVLASRMPRPYHFENSFLRWKYGI